MIFTYNGEKLDSELLMFSGAQKAYVDKLETTIKKLIGICIGRMARDLDFSKSVEKVLDEFVED